MNLFIDYNIALSIVALLYLITKKTMLRHWLHSFVLVMLEFIPPVGLALELLVISSWWIGLLREYLLGLFS